MGGISGRTTPSLFLIMLPFYLEYVKCYPHKRDLNNMPQVVNLLSEGQHMQTTQTQLLENITATTISTLPQIAGLMEKYSRHLQNITDALHMLNAGEMVASLEKLTKGFPFTARDCSDIAAQGPYRSGPYTITPWDERGSFKAFCDMSTEGEGWTVFQRRFDGSVDFYRDWEDYKNGFGNIDGEYWLGLDKLNRLTGTGESWQLRVELEDFDGNAAYAQYDDFRIGDESTGFQLTVGAFEGSASDALTITHADRAFTTKERDNDSWSSNCAVEYKGAWWYNACYDSNLNGPYLTSAQTTWKGIVWKTWKSKTTLKTAKMKIRPFH